MHVAFVISSLGGGGAEKILVLMANYWASTGVKVSVLLFSSSDDKRAYALDQKVNLHFLNRRGDSGNRIKGLINAGVRVFALRRIIKKIKPTVLIPFLDRTNICTVLAAKGLKVPVVLTEHNVPALNSLPPPWEQLRAYTYPRAERLVVLTEETRRYYLDKWKLDSLIIPNPVSPAPQLTPYFPHAPPLLLALGRLEPVKGFDQLLLAMKEVHKLLPAVRLEIWGEGSERENLERLINDLSLNGCVTLAGRTSQIYSQLERADVLVMTSRHEAFPNVILEAFTAGVPVISYDCPSGPRAIIDHGINGYLVPAQDTHLLAATISEVIQNKESLERMSQAAQQKSLFYSLDIIMDHWNTLLREVHGNSHA